MNKPELVAEIAKKSNVTKKDAEKILSATLEVITSALESGDRVQLIGFGTFEVRDRKASTRHDPRTKEKIEVPARRVPVFKAGQHLKNLVK